MKGEVRPVWVLHSLKSTDRSAWEAVRYLVKGSWAKPGALVLLRQGIQGGNPQARIPPDLCFFASWLYPKPLEIVDFSADLPEGIRSQFKGHHLLERDLMGGGAEVRDQGRADSFTAQFEDGRYLESSPGMPPLVPGLGQFPGVFDPAHFREHGRDLFSLDLP
mgnify:CR=1